MSRPFIRALALTRPVAQDSYIADLPAVRWLQAAGALPFPCAVTLFCGENGAGKSTLLEALAVAAGFNAEGGSRNYRFSTAATHSPLCESVSVQRQAYERDGFFLRAESFYNAATYLQQLDEQPAAAPPLADSYGGRSLHEHSHGESFMALVEHRFGGQGLYVLDEPEAALSPARQLELMAHIDRLVKGGSQFIIATHSPILLGYPEACIYEFSQAGIHRVAWKDTLHYRLTRRFLEQPEALLSELFEE